MVRTAERKLIRVPGVGPARLLAFDLAKDPRERSNLATSDPETAALRRQLVAWQEAVRKNAPERLPPAKLGARTRQALQALGYLN